MNYGETIKKMRKARGYSQEELVHGITSRTTLSTFENGSSRPTLDSVLDYLDRLNVSVEEFIYLSSKEKFMQKKDTSNEVLDVLMRSDVEEAKELISKLDSLYKKTKDIYFKLQKAQLIVVMNEFELLSSEEVDTYKRYIYYHLEKVETWGKVEIALFNNVMMIVPSETIVNVFKNASKKFDVIENLYGMEKLETITKTNAITAFLERGDYGYAELFLSDIEAFQENDLYHRTIHTFQWNVLNFIKSGDETSLEHNKDILHYLKLVNAMKLMQKLESFQDFIKKRRTSEQND